MPRKIGKQLQKEVRELLRSAERAAQRLEREQAEHQAMLAARVDLVRLSDKKPGSRPPEPPTSGVRETDQINLTDADTHIMKIVGAGFGQCYIAQAVVAAGSPLVVANAVTQTGTAKQPGPMLDKLKALPQHLHRCQRMLADNGHLSQANVERCAAAKIEPLVALGRTRHRVSWKQRFAAALKSPPASATPRQRMAQRLKARRAVNSTGCARKSRPDVRHHEIGDG